METPQWPKDILRTRYGSMTRPESRKMPSWNRWWERRRCLCSEAVTHLHRLPQPTSWTTTSGESFQIVTAEITVAFHPLNLYQRGDPYCSMGEKKLFCSIFWLQPGLKEVEARMELQVCQNCQNAQIYFCTLDLTVAVPRKQNRQSSLDFQILHEIWKYDSHWKNLSKPFYRIQKQSVPVDMEGDLKCRN